MGDMLKWDYSILYLSTIIGKFILHNPFWYLHIGITLEGSKKGEAEGSIQQNPLLVVPLDLDECPMGQQFQRQQELKLWWCSFLPQASNDACPTITHVSLSLCRRLFFHLSTRAHYLQWRIRALDIFPVQDFERDAGCCFKICYETRIKDFLSRCWKQVPSSKHFTPQKLTFLNTYFLYRKRWM